MAKRIAVVSDAVSSGHFFDAWYRYYSSEFGAESIYIITYAGSPTNLSGRKLGGLIELPCSYGNVIRLQFIGRFVATLLSAYDGVIRVDQDEFLVPKGGKSAGLKQFMEACNAPYLSAMGFDLIAGSEEEPLDLQQPILLRQRKYAYGNRSLNKIAYTTVPQNWTIGFHSSNHPPKFDNLFLFHLKFADIEMQAVWHRQMTAASSDTERQFQQARGHYDESEEKLRQYRRGVLARPVLDGYPGLMQEEYINKFLDGVVLEPRSMIYQIPFFHDQSLVRLPFDLEGAF